MAMTGEECWHQKPLRTKLDEAYDTLFDPTIAHNCDAFHELVVPAQRCGASCQRFKPFGQISILKDPSPTKFNSRAVQPVTSTDPAQSNAGSVRRFVDYCLSQVCQEIAANAAYLRSQIAIRKRQWERADRWLSRPEAQSEALGQMLANAEKRYSQLMNEKQRIKRRLNAIRSDRIKEQNFEELWLQMDETDVVQAQARQAKERAEELLIHRARTETELEVLYVKWQDAVERAPLLDNLRLELERFVREWLIDPESSLRAGDVDRVLRLLKNITCYAEDECPLAVLKKMIDALSRL